MFERSWGSHGYRAARRREKLGLPRVSDREAERRLSDNRSRTVRRHRAAARARGEAAATLGATEVLEYRGTWNICYGIGGEIRGSGREQQIGAERGDGNSL